MSSRLLAARRAGARGGWRRRKRRRQQVTAAVVYALLGAGGLTMVLPLVWMLSTSLKEPGAVMTYPPQFIPRRQRMWVDPQSGKRLGLFTARIEGRTATVAWVRNVEEAAVVRVLGADGRAVGEAQVPLYEGGQALVPVTDVYVRWRNYPDAATAMRLDRNWLSFEVPSFDVRVAGSTYRVGPWGWAGVPLRNAFAVYYLNSLIVAGTVTILEVITSALAAFAFARLRFPGRDALFLGYLGTLMVPSVVTMIPVFILLRTFRLHDTFGGLIIPVAFTAYGTFLLRQFFVSIPHELEDAARIDGCGRWGVFRHVVLPLSKPALATLATFGFLAQWNSFMWPLIVVNSAHRKTLMLGLYAFMGQYTAEWHLMMAAAVMVILPVIVIFVIGQRYFVEGIRMSGLKG